MANHLGHTTSVSDKDSIISGAIASFWKAFNLLMSDFGGLYSIIKCKLFKQYCCSFYGSNLWLLTSKRCYDICVAWRRALRKLWNVPCRTLAILSNNMPLEMSLDKRFIKFSNNVLNNSTGIIKSVASLSLYNPWSTFNRNNNYVYQMNGSSINESIVFKEWYDSISHVERELM